MPEPERRVRRRALSVHAAVGVVFLLGGSLGAPPLAAAVGPFGFARTDYLLESHLPGLDSVAIADVDGLHGPDIVALGYTAGSATGLLNVLLNNGDGSFAAPLAVDSCAGASSIMIGQFNPSTDSHLDVAMICGSTRIGRMLGDGLGNFAAVQSVDVGSGGVGAGTGNPYVSIVFLLRQGAMNGPTLAFAGYLAGVSRATLCFFGALQLEIDLDGAGGSAPFCNLHTDINGQLDDWGPVRGDLVLGEHRTFPGDVGLRDEAVSFGETFGDMAVTAYTPQFASTWSYGIRPSGSTGTAIELADVDGDGQKDILMGTDLVIADYVPGFPIAATPDHTFASIPFLYDMVSGDYNGDGKVDIAAIGDDDNADNDATLAIHQGGGDGTFAPYARFTTRGSASANYLQVVATGDLDGDGRPDLVTVGELDKYASVLLNRSPLFADGFESGDAARWSASFPP